MNTDSLCVITEWLDVEGVLVFQVKRNLKIVMCFNLL